MTRIRTTNSRAARAKQFSLSPQDAGSLLDVFRSFRVGQGEMLCFFGPTLEKHGRALRQFTAQGWLVKERFRGGYALTPAGFAALRARSRSLAADSLQRRCKEQTAERRTR